MALTAVLAGPQQALAGPPAPAPTAPSLLWSSPAQDATLAVVDLLSMEFDDDAVGGTTLWRYDADGQTRVLVGCDHQPARTSTFACVPREPLQPGRYLFNAYGHSLATHAVATSSVSFTVDPDVALPAPTLSVPPVSAATAAAVPVAGTAAAGAAVRIVLEDEEGGSVTSTVSATGSRYATSLDTTGLADGSLRVLVSTPEVPGSPVLRGHVTKDTVAPSVLSLTVEPMGGGTVLRWQGVLTEPRVRTRLEVRDAAGSDGGADTTRYDEHSSGADGSVGRAHHVHTLADGPLTLVLHLVDRVGNAVALPQAAVTKAVVTEIDRAHARYLAGGLDLGAPLGPEEVHGCWDKGCITTARSRTYAHGEIWSSDETGTHEVHGAIRQLWEHTHGTNGLLGGLQLPTSDELVVGHGRMNTFLRGNIYWSAPTGARLVRTGAALSRYDALGGPTGVLGFPLGQRLVPWSPLQTSPTTLWRHDFERGRLYGTDSGPVREIHGAILPAYVAAGGEPVLGVPVAGEEQAPGGRVSRLTGGHVYWSPATGAAPVQGAILAHYLSVGGPARFGMPLAGEEPLYTRPVRGRQSRFQGGTAFWTPGTGARMVQGAILAKYVEADWLVRTLGAPLTDEHPVRGGRASDFERGRVLWSPATGAHEVHGGIAAAYAALGGPDGRLGLPVTDEYFHLLEPRSDFQGGRIRWTSRGAVVSYR